jgi:cbb3-type cytochrome oxidase subunit 3
MSYDTVATYSQVTSLLMFVAMFIAIVAYALWPRNGARFERLQRRALDLAESPPKNATGFPSPLWGGARGGGTPDLRCSAIPPTLSLPHKGGGDAEASSSLTSQPDLVSRGRQ